MIANYWPAMVAVTVALFCRFQGMGWAAGSLIGGVFVVATPIGYYTGIAHMQHKKIAAEVAQLSAAAGPDMDVQAVQEKFKTFLDEHGYSYVDPYKDLVLSRTADGFSLRASYEFSAAVTPTLSVVVSFTDAPAPAVARL